jgi:hypothetical protein
LRGDEAKQFRGIEKGGDRFEPGFQYPCIPGILHANRLNAPRHGVQIESDQRFPESGPGIPGLQETGGGEPIRQGRVIKRG